jgi:hypothetical protein
MAHGALTEIVLGDEDGQTHVKRPADIQEANRPTPDDRQPQEVGTDEGEIDRILADSFPASDAPPWTLGVTSSAAGTAPTRNKPRG